MQHTSVGLISADSHVVEPADLFTQRFPAALADRAPRLVERDEGRSWVVEGADPVPVPAWQATPSGPLTATRATAELLARSSDPDGRLELQEEGGIDAEVLYPFQALWQAIATLPPDVQVTCVRSYNDWIAEFSSKAPDRLVGLGKVPATSSKDAAAEVLRCANELGLRGVVLDAWPGGSAAPNGVADDPFWHAVHDTALPVSVHYGLGPGVDTAPPDGIFPGMTPPLKDVAQPLLATGVFDLLPNVRIVFAHGDAGWMLHWLEHMDNLYIRGRHLESRRLPFEDPDALPSEYIRRHFWFTFHQDRSAVRNRRLLGVSNLMWASHFPYEQSWPDDRAQVRRVVEEVPADEAERLQGGNATRLYGLPGGEGGFAPGELDHFDKFVHI